MGSYLIVELQPWGERSAAVSRVGVRDSVGPFAQQRLDHAFRLTVGLRAVGSSAFGRGAEPATDFAEGAGAIGTPVVGQYALDHDAMATELADCTQPESGGRVSLLVRQDFDIGEARAVIHGDVGVFPPGAVDGVAAI